MKFVKLMGRAFAAVLKPLERNGAFVVFMFVLGMVCVNAVVPAKLSETFKAIATAHGNPSAKQAAKVVSKYVMDVAVAKQVMTDRLKAIYHTRTSYPELNRPAPAPQKAEPAPDPQAAQAAAAPAQQAAGATTEAGATTTAHARLAAGEAAAKDQNTIELE